jgi:hypothetical protein
LVLEVQEEPLVATLDQEEVMVAIHRLVPLLELQVLFIELLSVAEEGVVVIPVLVFLQDFLEDLEAALLHILAVLQVEQQLNHLKIQENLELTLEIQVVDMVIFHLVGRQVVEEVLVLLV